MEYQEAFLESLNNIGDENVNKFHEEVMKYLTSRVQGEITVSFDVNTQEITYIAHIDYDDRYFSVSIKIPEILNYGKIYKKDCIQFAVLFECQIEKYYLSKIFK